MQKYDAESGELIKTLFEEKNDKWVEPEHPVYFFSILGSTEYIGENFIWMSEKDGFMNLYLYKSDGTFIKQLTDNKWVVKEIIGDDGNYDEAIKGLEGVVGHVNEMCVADGEWVLARQEMHGGHVVEHRDLAVEHRDVDVLTAARHRACIQRRQHPDGAENAAAEIADRESGAHRPAFRRPRNRHVAARRLRHHVVCRPLGCGPGFAEPGDRARDDLGVDP